MKPKKYPVRLSDEQRQELESIAKRGKHTAATIKRAYILLTLDESKGKVERQDEIARRLQTSSVTIYKVSKQFSEEGL